MNRSYIWECHFFKETLKVFFLLLLSFLFLFMIIDLAFNAKMFSKTAFPLVKILLYYPCTWCKRAPVLIAFCGMIATIKVLTTSNQNRELVALMAGGISKRRILMPFLAFGLAGTLFLYVNEQWIKPSAMKELQFMTDHYIQKPKRQNRQLVNNLELSNGSSIVYQTYDRENEAFFDVFWILSADDIWHMKYLKPNATMPIGSLVDHITRSENGEMRLLETIAERPFPEICFDRDILTQALVPASEQTLSKLWQQSLRTKNKNPLLRAETDGTLYSRLAFPFLCLLSILFVSPFCLRYDRHFPLFMVYALCIMAFLIFYTLLNALTLAATNAVLPSAYALILPMALASAFSLISFLRKTT